MKHLITKADVVTPNLTELFYLLGIPYKEMNTDENSTHSIPPTTARFFRFYWVPEGSEPGSEDMDGLPESAGWRQC